MTALPLIMTVFVACTVEAIEALTIVLAAGLTREWRSTFQGMALALIVLAIIVAALGPTITLLPLTALRLVVGALLAIGGLVAAKFLFVDQALGPVIRSGILPEIDGATLVWVSPILLAIGAGLAAVSAYVTLRLYVKV